MIWLIIILVIIVVSFILALRSMRTYKEVPTTKFPYGIFLIKNEELLLENGVMNKLYDFCVESNAIISLERLFNGNEKALVLYAPQNVGQFVSELALLEIEDYLLKAPKSPQKKVLIDEAVVWSIKPKNESDLVIKPGFLKDLNLEPSQNFFWQIIMVAAKQKFHFQINIRAAILESDVHKKIELAKFISKHIADESSLERNSKSSDSIALLFMEYQKRIITPSEAEGFVLSSQTLKQLL